MDRQNLVLLRKKIQRIQKAANKSDLTNLMKCSTQPMTGGEKTKAELAGILSMDPQILFTDRKTNSLDPWMRQKAPDIFSRLAEKGCTVVLASSDLDHVQKWAQRVIWLESGCVYRQGSVRDLQENRELPN